MKKLLIRALIPMMILMSLAPASPVAAQGVNITVAPSLILQDPVTTGQTKIYDIKVIQAGATLDLEVTGLGQSLDGASQAIPPAQDTNPASCRSWITLDKSIIPAGANQNVKATLKVPAGTPAGEYYASLYFHTQPGTGSGTVIITGVLIPFIIIVNQPSFNGIVNAEVNSVTVNNAYVGRNINIQTKVTNTGNTLLRDGRVTVVVKNSAGLNIWEETQDVNGSALIPTYPRAINATFSGTGLAPGTYTAISTFRLSDGTVMGIPLSKDFQVTQPPAVPAVPVLTSPGAVSAPGPVVNTLTPTLTWTAAGGATSYNLVIKSDPYLDDYKVYEYAGLTGTSFTIPDGKLFNGGKYRWELTSVNAGGESAPSMLYFQTQGTSNPAVTATGVTGLTATGATLNANLTSKGGDASLTVSFEYGTSQTSFTGTTPGVAKSAVGGFNAPITGLIPNTVYYFRAKVQGAGAAVFSNTLSFITPATPATTPPPSSTAPPVSTTPPPVTSYTNLFPPTIDSASLSAADAAKLDNTAKAGVEVDASGASKVIAGRYTNDPQVSVAFSAGLVNGGMGKKAIKFAGVRVEGATSGNARVTFHYTDADIKDFEPTSLFLAYFSDGSWRRATGITISPANRTVSADIPLVRLSGTAIALGGTELKKAAGVIPGGAITGGPGLPSQPQETAVPWALVGIITAGILIIGVLIVVIATSRRRTEPQYYQQQHRPYDAE